MYLRKEEECMRNTANKPLRRNQRIRRVDMGGGEVGESEDRDKGTGEVEKCQDERQEGEDPEKDFWQESRGQGIQVGAVWIMGKEEGMVLKKGRM